MLELILSDESDTLKMGAAIMHAINQIESETVEVHLSGNLGAGKTTLVRGILQSTGWEGPVTSPSYTLCEEYAFDNQLFLHVDLYRISELEDVEILDLDRKTAKQKIIFIEWPENLLAKRFSHLIIELIHLDHKRQVIVKSDVTEIESLIKAHYEKLSRSILIVLSCFFAYTEAASNKVSFGSITELTSGNLRIVFKLEQVALINSYALDDPSRIVIDIKNTELDSAINASAFSPIKSIRASEVNETVRVVIDLKGSVFWKKPWQVKHNDRVDLILEIKRDKSISKNLRDIIVAIDAGHGGKDPGAVGKNLLEKDVTLLIAKELERTLKDTTGYQPIMIRPDDRFVNLNDRYQNARKSGADLFVSIHADAFSLSSVKGASVYVWAEEASSITADNLSKAELTRNPAVKSKIGKLDVRDFDEDAARTIFQIAYEAKIANSVILGEKILEQLKRDPFTKMHKPNVEFADFRVLKSIDIPSVLIESGFISNPDDAKRLEGKAGRRMIARSIFLGVHNYFKEKPKPNTFMTSAPKSVEYEIQKGDVISEIAIRFGVTINEIIQWNDLNNKSIYPGQKIKIVI